MEVKDNWYDRVGKEINVYKDTLNRKDYKKYKLEFLLRLAKRVEDFSSLCGECHNFQPEITKLTQDLNYIVQMSNLTQMSAKESRKSYFKTINNIIKHLKKYHKLVAEGQYIGIGMAIGVGIGAALGAALDNPAIGVAIGTGIGVAIGSYLDKKAKKEGRVI